MAYTVKKLAKISGISIRTLRFYDEIGLLKPAYYGENNYRYYEEEQVLILQQILFYRELGFPLKDIHRIIRGALRVFCNISVDGFIPGKDLIKSAIVQ
jgi:DNA-binding transcriptional MerR regulator